MPRRPTSTLAKRARTANDLLNRLWIDEANCAGTDPVHFFPSAGASHTVHAEARRICRACPVQDECLAYRLVTTSGNSDDGIWGGTVEYQRRDLARLLKLDRQPSDLGDDWRAFVARVGEAAAPMRENPGRQVRVA